MFLERAESTSTGAEFGQIISDYGRADLNQVSFGQGERSSQIQRS